MSRGLGGLNRSLDRAAHLLTGPLRALPPRLRAERGALCGTFLLRALASRARTVDEKGAARPALGDRASAANLIDVLAAVLVAAPSRETRHAVRRRGPGGLRDVLAGPVGAYSGHIGKHW